MMKFLSPCYRNNVRPGNNPEDTQTMTQDNVIALKMPMILPALKSGLHHIP